MLVAPLQFSVEHGIARVTLDRPELGNAITTEVAHALGAAVDAIAAQRDVRVVVIDANGPMFCAGGDIREFAQTPDVAKLIGDELVQLNGTLLKLAALPIPVIAAVHGAVAGGGIGLALTADVVIAAASLKFRAGYAAIGLSPDAGTSYHLTRLIGPMRAKEFLFTNRFIDAAEALALGLVVKVVPDAELAAETAALAERIANLPAGSHAAVKALVDAVGTSRYADAIERERQWMIRNAASADCREGIAAFVEKRRPAFAR